MFKNFINFLKKISTQFVFFLVFIFVVLVMLFFGCFTNDKEEEKDIFPQLLITLLVVVGTFFVVLFLKN